MSAQNNALPEAVRKLQLRYLQLSARAENTLIRAHIETIGALADAIPEQLLQIRNLGQVAYQETREALLALYQATSDEQVDWNAYCQIRDLLPQPIVTEIPKVTNGTRQQQVYDVPESIKPLVLGHLHLPTRIYNALQRADITTVGRLVQAMNAGIFSIQGLGPSGEANIIATFTALNIATIPDGGIDWFTFWNERNIKLIPQTYQAGTPTADIIHQLPILIREILRQDDDERDWRIVERRFGLNGSRRLKLDQLGKTFGLTRERVRQIEVKALRELRAVLLDYQYSGYMYHVHPEVLEAIRSIFELIATQANEHILETDLFQLIENQVQSKLKKSREALLMLFDIAGLQRIEFSDDDLVSIWSQSDIDDLATLEQVIMRIDVLLTQENAIPMEEFDILMHINKILSKQKKLSQIQLRRCLDLCSTIERRSDGLYWAKFVYIKSRGNQAERVLAETQRPMTATEIARVVNSRLVAVGKKKVEERNFVNQMVSDSRFEPIGRSGQWALASWDVETSSVIDLMERFLITQNEPVTEEQILTYVSSLRPVAAGSVKMYLRGQPQLFRQVDRTRWGLTSWAETRSTVTWNRKEVCDFVAEYFRQAKVKEVEYSVLREALAEAAQVSKKTAVGMLKWAPAIVTRREGEGQRYAVFQPDYAQKLVNGAYQGGRKNATLETRMRSRIREILEERPDFQLPLAELVSLMEKEFGCPNKTVYSYVRRADFADTFTVPGTRTRICRLKRASALNFPQVQSIADKDLRESLQRAIGDLSLDDVDVGLFQLGREFEVVIKRVLGRGSAKGKLTLSQELNKPQSQWKLIHMVDCAKQNGLITDLGVVNLLRQERNNRAHGGRPRLEERQALMNSAQYLAGLYIDYIILFEKHFQSFA